MRYLAFPLACLALAASSVAQSASPILTGGGLDVQVIESDAERTTLGTELVVYSVSEQNLGRDENADGDALDDVVHVFDRAAGVVHNLGWALSSLKPGSPQFQVSGPHVLVWVGELDQGGLDLNGDGDLGDAVLHWYDHGSTTSTNTALAGEGGRGFSMFGEVATFYVREDDQGSDLNGDLDVEDWVLHVAHFGRGTLVNTRLCGIGPGSPALIDDDQVITLAEESGYGPAGIDLNGNGTTDDAVMVVYEVTTGGYSSPGLASTWTIHAMAEGFIFTVPEEDQGADLNGDGDESDNVLHYYEPATGRLNNLGLAGIHEYRSSGQHFACALNEVLNNDMDLNGDGDDGDDVWHVVNVVTGAVTNLGLAHGGGFDIPRVDEGHLVFKVMESLQGQQDLNGDGDSSDRVLHSYSFARGTTRNHALGAGRYPSYELLRGIVAVAVSEEDEGVDLDGDGDTDGSILHLINLHTGSVHNKGLAIRGYAFKPAPRGFVVPVDESRSAGADLNGDGDAEDAVLFRFGWRNGLQLGTNWTFASHHGATVDGAFLFYALESEQGDTDLNGDGDADDYVLCLGRIR